MQAIVTVKANGVRPVNLRTFNGADAATDAAEHAAALRALGYDVDVDEYDNDQIIESQVWRRRSDGVEVFVARYLQREDDVHWETVAEPKRKGTCYGWHLRAKYDRVTESAQ
ncbi:hypothetical protein [Agromyces humi]|uniref:hypothetical protein n=1 Tax=Agromyces humi TaxID=1766800 RepID=UPI0013572189|nr:hypothetical protein [Agromyces humi]